VKASQELDGGVAEYLSTVPPAPEFSADSLRLIRERRAAMPEPELSGQVEHTSVVVPADPPVPMRIHRPKGASGVLPCIYSIHGGGYVARSAFREDVRFDAWCQKLGCLGASVEYRLGPEWPYPAALNDCYEGFKWLIENSAELGLDRERTGVFGASAGGGLAAALSLKARDLGDVRPAFQALLYPMIDDRQETRSSQWDDVPVWNPASNTFGWQSYLGELYGTPDVPAYAAVSRATDLRGLPPTYIMVGTLDAFLDENIAFAQRLVHDGVPTDLHVYAGGSHGFDIPHCRADVSIRARTEVDRWLASRLATTTTRG